MYVVMIYFQSIAVPFVCKIPKGQGESMFFPLKTVPSNSDLRGNSSKRRPKRKILRIFSPLKSRVQNFMGGYFSRTF